MSARAAEDKNGIAFTMRHDKTRDGNKHVEIKRRDCIPWHCMWCGIAQWTGYRRISVSPHRGRIVGEGSDTAKSRFRRTRNIQKNGAG